MTLSHEFSRYSLACHNSRWAQGYTPSARKLYFYIGSDYLRCTLLYTTGVCFCKKIHLWIGMEMESEGIEGCWGEGWKQWKEADVSPYVENDGFSWWCLLCSISDSPLPSMGSRKIHESMLPGFHTKLGTYFLTQGFFLTPSLKGWDQRVNLPPWYQLYKGSAQWSCF